MSSQDFTLVGTGARRRGEGDWEAGIGEGVSPPQPTRGFGGASWANAFLYIWDPRNTSGRENRRRYVPTKPVFFV